jgi:hypothetical protein
MMGIPGITICPVHVRNWNGVTVTATVDLHIGKGEPDAST